MLRVTPLRGSRWSPEGESQRPSSVLVEYGGARILWNVGHAVEELPAHDACLVSDSTFESAGGLPLYHRKLSEQQQKSNGTPATNATDDVRPAVVGSSGENARSSDSALPPIYATFPTVKMGQMMAYHAHATISLDGGDPGFSLQDVDDVFQRIHSIKHAQTIPVPRESPILHVTAHAASRVVGAALFVLERVVDGTTVVLCPAAWNLSPEWHLAGSSYLRTAVTPDALIGYPGGPPLVWARNARVTGHRRVSQAQRLILDAVLQVLRREGHVLLPTDASGRVLELVLLLHHAWVQQSLGQSYQLILVGSLAPNVLDFAACQLEWMHARLGSAFDEEGQVNPWSLPHLKVCTHAHQVERHLKASSNAACVICCNEDLEGGAGRDLLLTWADKVDHAIIFTDSSGARLRPQNTTQQQQQQQQQPDLSATLMETLPGTALGPDERPSPWTTAGQLLQAYCATKARGEELPDEVPVDVWCRYQQPLQGAALLEHERLLEQRRSEARQQQQELELLAQVQVAKGQLRLEEDDANPNNNNKAKSTLAAVAATTAMAPRARRSKNALKRPRKKSRFDQTLFLKFSKPLHMTFPVRDATIGIGLPSRAQEAVGATMAGSGTANVIEDDYGISIEPDSFVDIVSGVDNSKFKSGRIGDDVLRRGLGYAGSGPSGGEADAGAGAADDAVGDGGTGADDNDLDDMGREAIDLSEGRGIVLGRNGRPPQRVSTVARKVPILCEINYVPLEGRTSAQGVRQSVRALQPRRLVVLGGPCPAAAAANVTDDENDKAENTAGDRKDGDDKEVNPHNPHKLIDEVTLLAKAAESFLPRTAVVVTPTDGETVELDVGHAAYSVRLIDTPYMPPEVRESMMETDEENLPEEVVVEPNQEQLGKCMVSVMEYVSTGQRAATDGSLVLAPKLDESTTATSVPPPPPVYLSDGDVLLTDLRSELIAKGLKAEYSTKAGGTSQLLVNGKILVVKSSDTGRLEVEGPLCEDFYMVRNVVCGQFVAL